MDKSLNNIPVFKVMINFTYLGFILFPFLLIGYLLKNDTYSIAIISLELILLTYFVISVWIVIFKEFYIYHKKLLNFLINDNTAIHLFDKIIDKIISKHPKLSFLSIILFLLSIEIYAFFFGS